MTEDGAFRVLTVRSTDTVREAVARQQVEGVPAVQLGEVLTSAVLVRETMAPGNRVQVLLRDAGGNQVVGDAFPGGRTRGLVQVEDAVLGVRLADGGTLQVMRSLPARAPHQGLVRVPPEMTTEQALVAYFEQSEQVETMVGVGCVLEEDRVLAAGGYVVQLLPEVTAPPLQGMRERLATFGALAPQLVRHDADPEWLLQALLGGQQHAVLGDSPVGFGCTCSNDKALGAVAALTEQDLREMIAEGGTVRVSCDYCRCVYETGPEDLERILDRRG